MASEEISACVDPLPLLVAPLLLSSSSLGTKIWLLLPMSVRWHEITLPIRQQSGISLVHPPSADGEVIVLCLALQL